MLEDVIRFIKEKGEFAVKDIATEFDMDWNKARTIVKKLERNDIVEKVGRGKYKFKHEAKKLHDEIKEEIIEYLTGIKVPVRLSEIHLHLQRKLRLSKKDKPKTSRILKELIDEKRIKKTSHGMYILANYVEVEVGTGKKTIYKSPLLLHNLNLYWNCPKSQKITVKPCRESGQYTLDEYLNQCIIMEIGKTKNLFSVKEVFQNKRTKWWEIKMEADLDTIHIPIHIQIGKNKKEGIWKINLFTENSANPMTAHEFIMFMGWLKAKFPMITGDMWILKKVDINEDWRSSSMDLGKMKEVKLSLLEGWVLHIYNKQLENGVGLVRKEIQISDKAGKYKANYLKKVIEEGVGSGAVEYVQFEMEKLKDELAEKNKEMDDKIDKLLQLQITMSQTLIEYIKQSNNYQDKSLEYFEELNKNLQMLIPKPREDKIESEYTSGDDDYGYYG